LLFVHQNKQHLHVVITVPGTKGGSGGKGGRGGGCGEGGGAGGKAKAVMYQVALQEKPPASVSLRMLDVGREEIRLRTRKRQ
jgi:hypothetical protein